MKKYHYLFALILPFTVAGTAVLAEDTEETTTKDYQVGDYMDDASITSAVKLSFLKDEDLKASRINVETTDGVVHLTGKVKTKDERAHAVSLARNVNGVKAVREELYVE